MTPEYYLNYLFGMYTDVFYTRINDRVLILLDMGKKLNPYHGYYMLENLVKNIFKYNEAVNDKWTYTTRKWYFTTYRNMLSEFS